MSNWSELFVPEPVLMALAEEGFETPTEIQRLTLPAAIRDRQDILGAAETVSVFATENWSHIIEASSTLTRVADSRSILKWVPQCWQNKEATCNSCQVASLHID